MGVIEPKAKKKKLVLSLLDWFSQHARDLPWRKTSDPYGIWVSEIMLQQTQVKTVIPYWERWMRELPDIHCLAEAPSDKIHKLWEGLGYYTRVRNLQKAARMILVKYKGVFPSDYEDVLALPGVGRYTAGAICSIAFNQPRPILDGNVIRVLTRVFGIAGNPREKQTNQDLWALAADLVLQASAQNSGTSTRRANTCSHFNQSLMELGALICTPRDPKCLLCPIQKSCVAFRENHVAELPNLGERIRATERRFIAFIVQDENRFLVRQRPDGTVNAHLWEFPNVEVLNGDSLHQWSKPFVLSKNVKPACQVKHSITRYRITLQAFRADLPAALKSSASMGSWRTITELHELAFTSAHRKILEKITSGIVAQP